jgi:hypothetical protein
MNIFEIVIVTSVLTGFAAAFVAKAKGRSPLTWFLVGMLLNIIGLVAVASFTRQKRKFQS